MTEPSDVGTSSLENPANAGTGSLGNIFQFKISLKGFKPSTWRRLQVPDDFTFEQLHYAIQKSIPWTNFHLHYFQVNRQHIGPEQNKIFHKNLNEKFTLIKEHFTEPNMTGSYIYDLGSEWRHIVLLEDIKPAQKGVKYPRCTAGRQPGPVEDPREFSDSEDEEKPVVKFNPHHIFDDWDQYFALQKMYE